MYFAQAVRSHNVARILDWTRRNPGISRSGLANDLGLDKSTISAIVTELIEARVLQLTHEGAASPVGGRKPIGLSIKADAAFFGGIELRPDRTSWAVLDLAGDLVVSGSEPVAGRDGIDVTLQNAAADILGAAEVIGARVAGIGVGIPGIVDPTDSKLCESIPLGIREPVPIGRSLSRNLNFPVLVENDANCLAWGVLARGGGTGTYICVLFDTDNTGSRMSKHGRISVGLGLCLDGRIHHGREHSAGEFRSVYWNGGNSQFSLDAIGAGQFSTDPNLREVVFRELSTHLAFLVNTLNIESVFFSGDAVAYRSEITRHLTAAIQKNWSYQGSPGCYIGFEKYPDIGVAIGAAGLVLSKTYTGETSTITRRNDTTPFRLLESIMSSNRSAGRSA